MATSKEPERDELGAYDLDEFNEDDGLEAELDRLNNLPLSPKAQEYSRRFRSMLSKTPMAVERYVISETSKVDGPTEIVLMPPMPFKLSKLHIAPARDLDIAPAWVLFLIRLFRWVCFPWVYRDWDYRQRWYITLVYPVSMLYSRLYLKAQAVALANCYVDSITVGEYETTLGPLHASNFIATGFGVELAVPTCLGGSSIRIKMSGKGHVFVTALGVVERVA